MSTPTFHHSPLSAGLPTADYGWVADSLLRRIESYKAYPRLAQKQGWEGRVVVRATIGQDGRLLDAVVIESSGYAALDEDALKLMRRSCPLHFQRALDDHQVVVSVPVQYRLNP